MISNAKPFLEILSEPSPIPKPWEILSPEDFRSPWVEVLMKPTSVLSQASLSLRLSEVLV